MLPVSAWPPGPPGASLSPFGKPRQINVGPLRHGYPLPKGAWVVRTSCNSVVMRLPRQRGFAQSPCGSPGTGFLPGSVQPCPPVDPCDCGCGPPQPKTFRRYDEVLEGWRAWQRKIGRTDPPIRPLAGRRPPNWFGPNDGPADILTMIPANSAGTVLADGENVRVWGAGFATIIQAYSV